MATVKTDKSVRVGRYLFIPHEAGSKLSVATFQNQRPTDLPATGDFVRVFIGEGPHPETIDTAALVAASIVNGQIISYQLKKGTIGKQRIEARMERLFTEAAVFEEKARGKSASQVALAKELFLGDRAAARQARQGGQGGNAGTSLTGMP